MNSNSFILKIISVIRKVFKCSCYARLDENSSGTFKCWFICVDNVETYFNNDKFKSLTNSYYNLSRKMGLKIVFSCSFANDRLLAEYDRRGVLIR